MQRSPRIFALALALTACSRAPSPSPTPVALPLSATPTAAPAPSASASAAPALARPVPLPAPARCLPAGEISLFVGPRSPHSGRPLRVSTLSDAREATLMVSRSHRPPRFIEAMSGALGIRRVVPCGSVGVKVARVASAAADLYVHAGLGAKRWDACAPEAILAAAGGRFSDLDGAPIDYTSADLMLRNGLVASNEALFAQVRAAIAGARDQLG